MSKEARALIARMSLREPQAQALRILSDVVERASPGPGKDVEAVLNAIKAIYPQVGDFERDFPSLCFALATGVGKTRLMGAFIAYLCITGRSQHFFVPAPNLTIYEKLKGDFDPASAKYVFKGVAELAVNPPLIVTGENYESGIAIRVEESRGMTLTRQLGVLRYGTADQHFQYLQDQQRDARWQCAPHQAAAGMYRRKLFRLSRCA